MIQEKLKANPAQAFSKIEKNASIPTMKNATKMSSLNATKALAKPPIAKNESIKANLSVAKNNTAQV